MICISIAVPEGLVIAADSSIHGKPGQEAPIRTISLSANHLFRFTNNIAIANIGTPLIPTKTGQPRSLSSIIESMSLDYGSDTKLEELLKNFKSRLRLNINDYLQAGLDIESLQIDLVIAGFDDKKIGRIIKTNLKNEPELLHSTDNPGANWFGFYEVVNRLILGCDPRTTNPEGNTYEYIVPWGVMTLQDAIDFAVSLINITKEVSKYVHGVIKPGNEIEFVTPLAGGNIDVIAITNEQVKWISKKELSVDFKKNL